MGQFIISVSIDEVNAGYLGDLDPEENIFTYIEV